MIREIDIQGYRCLRDVHLTFTPLTVLVGPNGSGKSAILECLGDSFPADHNASWRKEPVVPKRIATFADGRRSEQPIWGAPKEWSYLRLHLQPSQMRNANSVQEARRIDVSGGNLVNVFATLTRKQQDEVSKRLCDLVPLYADLNARPDPSGAGYHRLVFQDRWDERVWYEPHEVSDGTILLLAFLTLPYMSPPVQVVGIEELEHALHPFLVGEVVSMLRRLAKGTLAAQPVQVVLATHSPHLLDCCEPEEVRFLKRDLVDGSTIVEQAPTGTAEWNAACDEYRNSLGEMWLSGGLGGVPGVPVSA